MNVKQTVVVLLILLGALFCQDAQAFYNPSIGRWLNRDPLSDDAFLRPLVQVAQELDRPKRADRLTAESLMPAYLFISNIGLNGVDILGLENDPSVPFQVAIPDCNIRIYAGHGLGEGWFDDKGVKWTPFFRPLV